MLTSEMVALELLEKVASHTNALKRTQEWCKQARTFEKALGRDVVHSKWNIQCYIQITKKELPFVRKIVGRLTMTGKTIGCSTPGKETVNVNMKPLSKEWGELEFQYSTKFRAGKCKIVEQPTSSYKTLVCSA